MIRVTRLDINARGYGENYSKLLKVIATGLFSFTIKFKKPDDTIVIANIDARHMLKNIAYTCNSGDLLKLPITIKFTEKDYTNRLDVSIVSSTPNHYNYLEFIEINSENVYVYVNSAEGETETPETSTETILFPPPETPMEFIERMSARLLHFSRRVSILRHEEPHLSSKSRRVCLDLSDRDTYVHRYDHSINLVRLPAGWLQLQINTYIQRLKAHEKKVEDANEAGTTPPNFNEGRLQEQIETLLEKIEMHLTEDQLLKHHETHNTEEWRNAHAARKIVLCNEDCSVGELIADINSFHTANGETNHTLAEQSFHKVAVDHWNEIKQTAFRELVTERTVTIA